MSRRTVQARLDRITAERIQARAVAQAAIRRANHDDAVMLGIVTATPMADAWGWSR